MKMFVQKKGCSMVKASEGNAIFDPSSGYAPLYELNGKQVAKSKFKNKEEKAK